MRKYFRFFIALVFFIFCLQFLYLNLIFHIKSNNQPSITIKTSSRQFKKFQYFYNLKSISCVNEIKNYQSNIDYEIKNSCPYHKINHKGEASSIIINSELLKQKKRNSLKIDTYIGETCIGVCRNINKRFSIQINTTCYCLTRYELNQVKQSGIVNDKYEVRDGGKFNLMYHKYHQASHKTKPAVICYILMLNGRDIVSIYLMIRRIYSQRNHYFIHVDQRQNFLRDYMKRLSLKYTNIYLFEWSIASIWGGASLLKVYRRAFEDILSRDLNWDFIINYSESHYLLKSQKELELFLGANLDKNFVRSSGGEKKDFIDKQGLRMIFVECDSHMYLIGQRKLPNQILIDGGSDWFVLNRKFIEYLTQVEDSFVMGLYEFFENSLLPAESFFHTALQNSQFCNSVINSNLLKVSWDRNRGCHCQHSSVIGWCGCSPVIIDKFYWFKLKKELIVNKSLFFARKFDRAVDTNIFDLIDGYHGNDGQIIYHDWLKNNCWSNLIGSQNIIKHVRNFYSSNQDGDSYWRISIGLLELVRSKLARNFIGHSCIMEPFDPKFWSINIFAILTYEFENIGSTKLFIVTAEINQTMTLTLLTRYRGKAGQFVYTKHSNSKTKVFPPIQSFMISQNYDMKENLFEIPPYLMQPNKTWTLEIQFKNNYNNLLEDYLQFYIMFIDPDKNRHSFKLPKFQLKMQNSSNTYFNPYSNITHVWFQNFDIKTPIVIGIWRAIIFIDEHLTNSLIESWFEVIYQSNLLRQWRIGGFITNNMNSKFQLNEMTANENDGLSINYKEGFCISFNKKDNEHCKEDIASNLLCHNECRILNIFDNLLPKNL